MEVEKSRLAEEMAAAKECGGRRAGEAASVSAAAPCFDCNICLEPATDPVVTLCGHLYCWPCAYRWLRSDRSGSRQCPVCKAAMSEDRLVPLYGRGLAMDAAQCKGLEVPSRPASVAVQNRAGVISDRQEVDDEGFYFDVQPMYHGPGFHPDQPVHQHHHLEHRYYGGTDFRSWPPVFHSNAGCVIGGMAVAMLPWAFRSNEAAALDYNRPYRASPAVNGSDRRLSRRQRQVESSLHQIWLFLAIFAVLCFLLS